MTEAVALDLMRKAMGAGMRAEIHGEPARVDTTSGVPVTVAANYQVRIINPNGPLGPDVLKVLAQANVSLGSSDALVV